mmetsp:Transcript_42236/g.97993  ORF Transcript_42236/g.97993 Transcript_42236/m.97993 type:complete len:466 (-) Transcript_42236:877-2274(-)
MRAASTDKSPIVTDKRSCKASLACRGQLVDSSLTVAIRTPANRTSVDTAGKVPRILMPAGICASHISSCRSMPVPEGCACSSEARTRSKRFLWSAFLTMAVRSITADPSTSETAELPVGACALAARAAAACACLAAEAVSATGCSESSMYCSMHVDCAALGALSGSAAGTSPDCALGAASPPRPPPLPRPRPRLTSAPCCSSASKMTSPASSSPEETKRAPAPTRCSLPLSREESTCPESSAIAAAAALARCASAAPEVARCGTQARACRGSSASANRSTIVCASRRAASSGIWYGANPLRPASPAATPGPLDPPPDFRSGCQTTCASTRGRCTTTDALASAPSELRECARRAALATGALASVGVRRKASSPLIATANESTARGAPSPSSPPPAAPMASSPTVSARSSKPTLYTHLGGASFASAVAHRPCSHSMCSGICRLNESQATVASIETKASSASEEPFEI